MHRINLNLHEIFQALSDPYRIRIVALLLRTKEEICLCEFSESLREPEYKLSRHVKILKSNGILTSVRDGKWIYHSLVKSEKFLKLIYQSLEAFPDDDETRANDYQHFMKKAIQREKGRCLKMSKVVDDVKVKKGNF